MKVETDESARFIRGRVNVSNFETLTQLANSVLGIWLGLKGTEQHKISLAMGSTGRGTLTRLCQLFQKLIFTQPKDVTNGDNNTCPNL